jgi:hypothetical protein
LNASLTYGHEFGLLPQISLSDLLFPYPELLILLKMTVSWIWEMSEITVSIDLGEIWCEYA